ncbi:MAG: alpha/beta hydrolase [Acuticoccus sp.]
MKTDITPDMQAIIDRLNVEDAGIPDWVNLPAAEGRAMSVRNNRRWNIELPEMDVVDGTLAGLPARTLTPPNDTGKGAILFVHGGGFAFCSQDTHARSARSLALAAGAPVVTFDYRLAPEHPFPAGLDDVRAAWAEFAPRYDGRRLGIAGDSAGANLSVTAMLAGLSPMPDCGLLFYGVFGSDFETPSYKVFANASGLTRARMIRFFDWYVPQSERDNPLVTPLKASDAALKALPPLYLNAAGIDPLLSDAELFCARLRSLGRDDPFDLFDGVLHGFMQMTVALPAAREAHEAAGTFFRKIVET